MLASVTGVVDTLQQLPPLIVLVLAVLLVAGETGVIVGLFFPVEITLLTVGFLAYLGEVPLAAVCLLMIAAALTGDALALRSGRKYGPRVRASRLGEWVGEQRWSRADRILHRLGGRSAFVARWLPFVRTLLPRLAGSAGMSYRSFAPWNAAGVVTMVGSSVVLGYLAGASYQRVAETLGRATTAVLLLLVVIAAIVVLGRWLGRHPYPVRALATRAAALPSLRWLSRRYGALFGRISARTGPGWALVLHLATGLALLFSFGFVLSWLVQLVVAHSGLSEIDIAIAGWFADRRTEPVVAVGEVVAKVLRGTVLIAVVALVAVFLAGRSRRWRTDPVGIGGSAGAFLPLVVLAIVAEFSGGDAGHRTPTAAGTAAGMFSTQTAVATAGICILAWLVTRRAHWPRAVAGWTAAAIGIVLMTGSRLYLGWDTTSETVTAVLLGALWPAVFMIAWAARDRAAPDGAAGGRAPGGRARGRNARDRATTGPGPARLAERSRDPFP
jgi:undecaprenyl-diphosphatase